MAFTNCRRPLDARSAQIVLEVRFELLELLSLACEFISLDHADSPLANVVRHRRYSPRWGRRRNSRLPRSRSQDLQPSGLSSSVATTLSSRAEPVSFCAKYGGHRVHFMADFMP